MKTALFALSALLLAAPSFAESYTCAGIDGDEGKVLRVEALGSTNVPEGTRMPFRVEITHGDRVLFGDEVTAVQSDVMLMFRNRRGQPRLSGTIYLDELNQTWIKAGGKEMRFDCDSAAESGVER